MIYLLILALGIGGLIFLYNANQKKIKQIKKDYDIILKGTDKRAALEAGRKYYKSVRGGQLSIYDEQALTNDISTMKDKTTLL
jgi:hypothetical protein